MQAAYDRHPIILIPIIRSLHLCWFGSLLLCGLLSVSVVHVGSSEVSNDVRCSDETLVNRMRVISGDFDWQLNNMMAIQAVTYSTVNTTKLPYNASIEFNPKGMGQLYNVTNMFIDFVQARQAYPEGMITLEDGNLQFADPAKKWKIIVTHYGGLVGLALISLILASILPCIGLFFCCCRCAGNCGARSEPFDKKHDHCRKIMLSTVLICVTTVILFGVVCAFVTNEYMQDGTKQFPENIETSLKDLRLYLITTKRQIETLLKTNFKELEKNLDKILQESGRIVTERLAEYTHAVSLMNLNEIVAGLDTIKQDLKMMLVITQNLRANASELDIVVRGVKKSLLHTLSSCNTHTCKEVLHQYQINEMSVQVDFDKLPDVTSALRKITQLMDENIVQEVSQGRESFLRIQKDIQRAVNQTIPVVSSSIRRVGNSLEVASQNLTGLLDRFINEITNSYIPGINIAKNHINEYAPYRHYLGLGISGILLSVVMCLTFGLFCGICGKRPDGYGDDCCNKGSGARFLLMAVWIIFSFTSILMIVTAAHMITGVAVQRGICEPLKNPKDNRIFELLDDYVKLKKVMYGGNFKTNINMSYIVTTCHANETIYKVLMFENIIDVNSFRNYVERYDINRTIQQLRQKIIFSPGIIIFSDKAREKLNDLAESGLSDIKFYQYAEVLEQNITNINLHHLASKLREVSAKLSSEYEDTKDSLEKNAHDLDHYHRDLVVPMATLSEQLSESALIFQEHIKFNHSSMSEAIHDLMNEVTQAQDFLNKEGPEYVQLLANRFGKAFVSQIEDFLEHVISTAKNNVGKCGPVSNAYNATLVAGCNKILDPFNGFWMSVGWCLLLFIPTIVLCVKLSNLYQKSDPYPGALVEANWDFPHDGPPRYQPPAKAPPLSSEYERPPPYYYPGPGGRD